MVIQSLVLKIELCIKNLILEEKNGKTFPVLKMLVSWFLGFRATKVKNGTLMRSLVCLSLSVF